MSMLAVATDVVSVLGKHEIAGNLWMVELVATTLSRDRVLQVTQRILSLTRDSEVKDQLRLR
jgi:hypothetical protein